MNFKWSLSQVMLTASNALWKIVRGVLFTFLPSQFPLFSFNRLQGRALFSALLRSLASAACGLLLLPYPAAAARDGPGWGSSASFWLTLFWSSSRGTSLSSFA